jgi:hypothetical protein
MNPNNDKYPEDEFSKSANSKPTTTDTSESMTKDTQKVSK